MSNFLDTVHSIVSKQETPVQTPPVENPAPVAPVVDAAPPAPPVAPPVTQTPETPAPPADTPAPEVKAWYEDENSATPPAPPVSDPVKPDVPAAVVTDPDYELLKKFKDAGKTLKDLIADYQIEDVSNLQEDQLVSKGLQKFYGLNGDALDDELVRYKELSPVQKVDYVNQIKKRFDDDNANKLKQLTEPLEKKAQENQALFMQNVQRFETDVNDIVSKLPEQELYGVKVTPEMAETVKNEMLNFGIVKDDGSFDAGKIFEAVFATRFLKDIVRANVTASKNAGRQEILAEVHNPNPNIPGTLPPKSLSPDEAARLYIESKRRG